MAQITLNSTGVASNGSLVLQSNGTTAAVTIDTSQRAAFVAGTEALPAITTTGDTNTGMWFPAADTIAFSEGGAEAMRIDSDGDVGIGTSSPSDKLTVISAGTQVGSTNFRNIARIGLATNDASVLLGYDVSAGSAILASTNNYPIAFWTSIAGTYAEKMRIDSSGNVGIGTSSPSYKLDVSATSFIAASVSTSNSGAGNIRIADASTTSASAPYIGSVGNNLTFGRIGTAEYARIDSSGNVGIGTSSPTEKCHIYASSGNSFYKFQNAATGSGASDGGFVGIGSGGDVFLYNYEASNTVFSTNNTERMRINSSGALLLNTTTTNYGSVSNFDFTGFSNGIETTCTTTGSIFHLLVRNGNGLLGGVNSSGSTIAYTGTSDYRLKENITPMTGALAKVSALNPVTYKWKVDGSHGEGFIAHELAEVCPIAVYGEKDELNEDGSIKSQSVDTSFLVATLTAAIQEQQVLITALTARITALESN
jgi:hypothetical protein